MKHLSAILAIAILLSIGLACSDSGNAAESSNTGDKPSETNKPQTTSGNEDGVYVEWIALYNDDGSGGEGAKVEGFKPTDNPQHFKAHMSEFEGGTKLKFVWTAVNAGGEKNLKIFEKELETTSLENEMTAKLKMPNPFPEGTYKLDVFVNGKLSKTLNYKVQ
jgi:hypothetical protein